MMKINELTDGTRGKFCALISSLNKGVTAKGATYLSFVLQDKTEILMRNFGHQVQMK